MTSRASELYPSLFFSLSALLWAATPANAAQPLPPPFIVAEDLCSCDDRSIPPGGITTPEEFRVRHDWLEFSTPREKALAWRVYQVVNYCDAEVVIGRLEDTQGFPGDPKTCVMRDYRDWTPAINDTFIVAALDRSAKFRLVSPPIKEIELEPGGGAPAHRRNVYNRELSLIRRNPHYQLLGRIEHATPESPVFFVAPERETGPAKRGPACSFTGNWRTNWGDMSLEQSGARVSGNYVHDEGSIEGTVERGVLIGRWTEAPSRSPPKDAGDLEFTLTGDCGRFSGTWRYGSTGPMQGGWDGTRR